MVRSHLLPVLIALALLAAVAPPATADVAAEWMRREAQVAAEERHAAAANDRATLELLDAWRSSRRPSGTVYFPEGALIPGYGQSEPAYLYARTDTVEARTVGNFWQSRFLHLVVDQPFQGTVSVEAIPRIQEKVRDFRTTGPATVEVFMTKKLALEVQPCTFVMNQYWRFEVLRRFAIVRTDYELWRAERDYLLTPHWERVGTTYELTDAVEEPLVIIDTE